MNPGLQGNAFYLDASFVHECVLCEYACVFMYSGKKCRHFMCNRTWPSVNKSCWMSKCVICEGRGITPLAPSLGGCGFVSPEQISIRALAWHHSPAHSSAKNKRAQCLHGHHCTLDVCVTTIHWQRTIFIGPSNGRLRKQPMAMWHQHLITAHWLLYISIERKRERFCPLERAMQIHFISNHSYQDFFLNIL